MMLHLITVFKHRKAIYIFIKKNIIYIDDHVITLPHNVHGVTHWNTSVVRDTMKLFGEPRWF